MPEKKSEVIDKLQDLVFESTHRVKVAQALMAVGVLTPEEVDQVIDEVRGKVGLEPLPKGRKE